MIGIDLFRRRACLLSACLFVGCLLLSGCSDGRPRREPVSGRVLIDGKPLEAGFIRVTPSEGRPASGSIGPDGRFHLKTYEDGDGCVPGNHPVAIIASKNIGDTATKWFAPKKYASPKTSGVTLEVTGPRDDVEINLSWKGSGHDQPFTEKNDGE